MRAVLKKEHWPKPSLVDLEPQVTSIQSVETTEETDRDALVDGRPGHRRRDRQLPREQHFLGRRADGALLLRKGVIDPPS